MDINIHLKNYQLKKWPSRSLIEKGPVEDIVNECN